MKSHVHIPRVAANPFIKVVPRKQILNDSIDFQAIACRKNCNLIYPRQILQEVQCFTKMRGRNCQLFAHLNRRRFVIKTN